MNNILSPVLQKNKEKYINKLVNFIKCDTHDIEHGINGGLEKNGQEYLEKLLTGMGAKNIEHDNLSEDVIINCQKKYHEGNLGHNYKDRYNLYAQFKGSGEKSILFNGHVDTMPVGNRTAWDFDPLSAPVKDNKIYGLGACDMKAGLMAAIMAVELIKDAGLTLPGTVKIASVCDEEGGGNAGCADVRNGCHGGEHVLYSPRLTTEFCHYPSCLACQISEREHQQRPQPQPATTHGDVLTPRHMTDDEEEENGEGAHADHDAETPEVDGDKRHELVHVEQWRHYGLAMPLLYALAGHNPLRNRFEIEAGLEDGGYVRRGR